MVKCPTCRGSGLKKIFPDLEFCDVCDGEGEVVEVDPLTPTELIEGIKGFSGITEQLDPAAVHLFDIKELSANAEKEDGGGFEPIRGTILAETQEAIQAEARTRSLRKRYGPKLYEMYMRGSITWDEAEEVVNRRPQ